MKLFRDHSLKIYNTFGVDVMAKYLVRISNIDEIQEFLSSDKYKDLPRLVLGGGSNILFTDNFPGVVICPDIRHIDITDEDSGSVFVKAGAGISWNGFVEHAVSKGWGGIENLVLIPGNVGATPVQNIGAYGVEISNVLVSAGAVDLITGEYITFTKKDCRFGYRDSIFKNELADRYFITDVTYRLTKKHVPVTHYGEIEDELKNFSERNIETIKNAIISIRRRKLPDPKDIGNAGSFFKNPVISIDKAKDLQAEYPDIALYDISEKEKKVAAGWLIEKCEWKGRRSGNAGIYKGHALILVNHGNATGKEIYELSEEVIGSVFNKFGIKLEKEVKII